MSSKILKGLNLQQKEAVLHEGGPLLVLAGAGSGKTRVITRKIAYLIKEKGIDPSQILAVTFTNKAANEMKERISSLLGSVRMPWMGTFHANASKILRREFPKIGKSSNFTIMDTSDQLSIIRDCFKELNIDSKETPPIRVLHSISYAKNHLKTVEDFSQEAFGKYPSLVAEVYALYQEKLRQNQAMDFDDLIFEAILLLKNHEDIRNFYKDHFKYILIDEYQDVNHAQYTLTKYLLGEHRNICAVGDDDQAIYGFRGADVSILLRFEKDFKGAKIIKLEENYRSTPIILEAANAVVRHNKGRKEKRLWTSRKGGEKIGVNAGLDAREEARFVVKEINRWLEKGIKFRDFAILYRTNAQSRAVEEVLKQEGIDYQIVGGVRFYDRAEIKDIIGYLKLIINPRDYMSFRRVVNIPSRGIGSVTRDKVISYSVSTGKDLVEVMEEAYRLPRVGVKIQNTLRDFAKMLRDLQSEKEKMALSDFVDFVIKRTGYMDMLTESTDAKKFERIENIEELVNDAKDFEVSSEDPSLEAFLEKVSLYTDVDEAGDIEDDGDGKVTLMTVHAAKGLEFPIVFIIGLEEGLFPHIRSIQEGTRSAIEEERRLFYVAMTRAKKKVYLTYARERTLHGKSHSQSPSRFLREVPEDLIDRYLPELSHRSFARKAVTLLGKAEKRDKFSKGDVVYHKIFGKGIVKKSEKGYVTVEFDGYGVKILSQDYLNPYSRKLKPGDKVKIEGGLEGILKKEEGGYAYVILSGGDVERVEKSKVVLRD